MTSIQHTVCGARVFVSFHLIRRVNNFELTIVFLGAVCEVAKPQQTRAHSVSRDKQRPLLPIR